MRKWAFLLSIVAPGAGHVLMGRWRRGAVLVALGLAALVSARWIGAYSALAMALIYLALLVDTLVVRAGPTPTSPKILWGLVAVAAVWVGGPRSIRSFVTEAFKIPSGGMSPTLLAGDHVFLDKTDKRAARGDTMVFSYPIDPQIDFVDRVVAVAGDRVAIRHGRLILDGTPVPVGAPRACSFTDFDDTSRRWVEVARICVEESIDGKSHILAHDTEPGTRTVRRFDWRRVSWPTGWRARTPFYPTVSRIVGYGARRLRAFCR